MAKEAAKSNVSADSYIGSFISLICKSDIRYEGFLFHLNPKESIIGLRNVKSFGTEGRRKDSPQLLPSDKVYESVFFRGSDIQDLQVISSPSVQSTTAVPNDPAIVQSHYPCPAFPSTSLSSHDTVPVTYLNSNTQTGIRTSSLHGDLPLHRSVENSVSLCSLPHLSANINGLAIPSYSPGFNGSLRGTFHLQHQSLPQPAPGLAMSAPMQQQMQFPNVNASLANGALKFAELPHPLLPAVCSGSENLTSMVAPPSTLSSSLPMAGSSTVSPNLSLGTVSNSSPNALPTLSLGFSLPLLSSVTTSVNGNMAMPSIPEKPKSVIGSMLPYQVMSGSLLSNVGTSGASESKMLMPSLVTPCELQQLGLPTSSLTHSLQTAQKNREVFQRSTSEPSSSNSKDIQGSPSSDPEDAQEPPSLVSKDSQKSKQHISSVLAKKQNGGASYTVQSNGGHAQRRRNRVNGAALHGCYNYRSHAVGRGNGLNGAALRPHHTNRGHSRGRAIGTNEAALHTRWRGISPGWGRGNKVSPRVTKFTEDFDFKAMNEKFNKAVVWGCLGRGNRAQLEDEGDKNGSARDDAQEEVEDELPNFNLKPVYVKDEFFDSLSCDSINQEFGRGKMKLSEQMRKDTETFGEVHRYRRGPGIQGQCLVKGSRGAFCGRGCGHAIRGRGRTVWSRIT